MQQETENPEVVENQEEEMQQEQPVGGEAPVSNEEIERELEEAAAEEELTEVEKLTRDVAKWHEAAIRSAADLENFRKRMSKEKADAIRFGNQKLVLDLLPVIDNFNMGMMAAEQDSGSMIYMGMQMVQKQMVDFLENQDVKQVACNAGDVFDPNQHDAMSQEVSEEFAEGQIIRVMRAGYKMGDRLLRPANVVVSSAPQAEEKAIEEPETPES